MPTRRPLRVLASEATLRATVCAFARSFWRLRLVENGVRLPDEEPCFLYGNHSNNLDPFMINQFMAFGNPTAGVMTMEYLREGFVANVLKGIGLLPTRKHVPEPHLIRRIYGLLREGRRVMIYPEGGRRWDGRPAPWIDSTAKLFARARVPVYPVITHGSYVGWPRWATYPRPARIRVEIRPPFLFDRSTPLEQATAQMKAAIAVDENRVPEDVKPRRAYRPADGIHKLLYRDPDTGAAGGVQTPDGTTVVTQGGRRWTMLPDSTLVDATTGAVETTGDLYARIRALPLGTDAHGAVISNRVALARATTPGRYEQAGVVEARLYPDGLRLRGPSADERIGLEHVQYTGIERNFKLQLTLEDRVVQLSFNGEGSALHWEDTIRRLQHGERP